MATALATPEDVADVLGETFDQPRVERLILKASDEVERHCRRRFARVVDDVDDVDVDPGGLLWLADGPLEQITSIIGPDGAVPEFAWSIARTAGGGVLALERTGYGWATGRHQVIWTHGYETYPGPVTTTVATMVARHLAAPMADRSETISDYSHTLRDDVGTGLVLTPADEKRLRPYRVRLGWTEAVR